MSLCRLCLCPYQDKCKELINASGECTDAYDIASKYFDPMLLMSSQNQNPAIVCFICWQHIQDFYYFQDAVLEAHSKFNDVKEHVSVIKVEVEKVENLDNLPAEKLKHETNVNDKEDNTLSSDDELPLIPKQNPSDTVFVNSRTTAGRKSGGNRKTKKLDASDDICVSNDDTCHKIDKADVPQKTLENDAFIASWRSELDCAKCNAIFGNFTLLRKHFVKEHSDEKCYIVCCDRKFRSRYHIVEHIRLHLNPNAYRCDVCGRCSTNSRNLSKHIKELHSEEGKQRSLECPTCLKTLANKNSLKVHMETHETNLNFICRECGKGFPSEQKRTLHERYVHNAELICDQCGKTLHNHYAMKQHLLQHAGIKKRKWPCGMCKAELNSRSGLKMHIQLVHQDGSTVFVCSVCGKVATTQIALLRHKQNVHLSDRKHKCAICNKAFKFPRVLREHMATHTGEDLYQCPYCDRTFKTNANMHHHRKKAHPQQWAEGRLNRPQTAKVDFNLVQNEVII